MKIILPRALASFIILFSLTACMDPQLDLEHADQETNDILEMTETEAVTLTMNYPSEWGMEQFNQRWKEPVENALPHITLEAVDLHYTEFDDAIIGNELPDLLTIDSLDAIPYILNIGLATDLDSLVERHGFDLDRLEPTLVDYVRNLSDGALTVLPTERNIHALYYNQHIFDLLGQPYPDDGMNWDDVIQLARFVSPTQNEHRFHGLDLAGITYPWLQLSTLFVDSASDTPLFDSSDDIARYFQMIDRALSIPGNEDQDFHHRGSRFVEDQDVAMFPFGNVIDWYSWGEENRGLQWDVVTYPEWPHLQGIGPPAFSTGHAINPLTEHPDAAFDVLIFYLRTEHQRYVSTEFAKASPLVDREIHETFGAGNTRLSQKNMNAFFELEPAPSPIRRSEYERDVQELIDYEQLLEQDTDVSTYLRELQQQADERIKKEDIAE